MRLVQQGTNFVLVRADGTIASIVYDSTPLQAARMLTKRRRMVLMPA